MRELSSLSAAECERLLRGGVVGRIAVTAASGPHIVPVNYAYVGDAVVVRTSPESVLGAMPAGAPAAFEIDQVDYDDQRGWSVVLRGTVDWLTDPEEIARVAAVWEPRPWVAGDRSRYLSLRHEQMEGRRIGLGWDLQGSMPVWRSV